MKEGLKGKVAIVTGGAKGIGKGIADLFASQGANVVVADLSEEKTKHLFVKCDISNAKDCQNLVKQTLQKFGALHILINNAGIYPFVSLTDMTEEQWDKVIAVNLKGTFNCTKAALSHLQQKKYGKIVNIASIAGAVIGYANLSHYCATKAGIMGFTRATALELAPYNIQVNAIAPGGIRTPGVDAVMDKKSEEAFAKSVPEKRMGTPEDIAQAVLFLASDAASYITGQLLVVDGGLTMQ
ncbi:MAG TPA: SDR family NAD(P)-dependent oxidoreductase [Candidatus Nanoarchaeia archaeon]|nr:SDR family NAD(P)-dependent oxidoreductase [Candidatus Nanoarchaeia archaeon]